MKNLINAQTVLKEKKEGSPFDISLVRDAADSILKLIIDCANEKDPDLQAERARAAVMLTDALAKFDFKIIS